MKTSFFFSALTAATLAGSPGTAPAVEFQRVFPNIALERPVQISIPPDGSNRRFLVLQRGLVLELPENEAAGDVDPAKLPVFLDLTSRALIANQFEEGLLNLTFHPDFKNNGKLYVYHTQQHPKRSQVVEYQVSKSNPQTVDLSTERVLLEAPQPFWNHNSGNMLFGPDGYLYITLGDGGKGNDPHRLGQNLWVFNGKMLRIDVNGRDGDLEYAIPPDNPFAKTEGVRPEIWAYGLRNPWGIHFDQQGRLWCADVGQNLWEEIDLIEKGGNYGWNFREGLHKFDLRTDPPPADAKFIDPIHEYPRTDGLSITGGVVYRGDAIPALKGYYLYGDFVLGTVWALKYENGKVTDNHVLRPRDGTGKFKPTAFCEDTNHEVFVLSWGGKIYKITP